MRETIPRTFAPARHPSGLHRIIVLMIVAAACCCCGCTRQTSRQQGGSADTRQEATPVELKPVVQVGHTRALRHIVFSPDGRYFLTSARFVFLWDAATGDKLRSFPVDARGLEPQFCLDGRAVVIGGNVFDNHSGEQRYRIVSDDETPGDVEISADGRRVVVGTREGEVRAVDLVTGAAIGSLSMSDVNAALDSQGENIEAGASRDRYRLLAVGFRSDNEPLALLSDQRSRVAVWNVATKQEESSFECEHCYSGEFSPDGRYVIERWDDTNDSIETATVYDAVSGHKIVQWTSRVVDWNDLSPVAFAPDGRFCLGRSTERGVTMWDLQTGSAVHRFGGHAEPIVAFRLFDDGKKLETRSSDIAQRWDVDSGRLLKAFRNPSAGRLPDALRSVPPTEEGVVPSPDGTTFVCDERIFDAATGSPLRKLAPLMSVRERMSPHAGSISVKHTAFAPSGKLVILAWQDRYGWSQAAIFNVESGKTVNQLSMVLSDARYGLQWNRDGRRALTCSDGLYRLWDVERGRPLQTIGRVAPRTIYPTPQIAFSENGKYVYVHGRQFGVFFWDAETGEALHHEPPGQNVAYRRGVVDGKKHPGYYVGRSVVSADRRFAASWYLAIEDWNHKTIVWDVEKAAVAATLEHPPRSTADPYFSLDGRYLALVCRGADERIVVWHLASGRQVCSFVPQKVTHPYSSPSVWFLSDGERMLVNSAQRELTLHHVATGELIHRMVDTRPIPKLLGLRYLKETLLISPDNRYVLADYAGDYAIVWDLQTGEQVLLIERDIGAKPATEYFCFSDDGRRLLTRYKPATLWNLESGEVEVFGESESVPELPGFGMPPVSESKESGDPPSVPQEILDRFREHIPEISGGAELTADGRRLIVYHDDGGIAFWDVATGEPLYRCYQFHNGSRWLTVRPDGKCYGSLQYVRYRRK